MRSALYFGSFNPPHIGHEGILRYLKECGDFDDICVVLSPQNPLKDKRLLLDEGERCKMVKAWIGTLPFVRCSTIEFEMEKPSYTYLTMRRFRLEQPETLFALVMGADSLSNLHHWRCYEELLQHHAIYVYPREGYPFVASAFPALQHANARICWMQAPLFPCSSSAIRQMLEQNGTAEGLLPPVVWDYIRTHHLYGVM